MDKWKVVAYRGHDKKRRALDRTYVRAPDAGTACRIGDTVLRTRIRGSFTLEAFEYHPEGDPAFVGYLRPCES